MNIKRLPGTQLDWSRIGLGCWAMGGEYWGSVNDKTSLAAMECAAEQGINWFDTAPLYGKGRSERLVGQFARTHDIGIATKVGVRWDRDHAESDLSPKHLAEDIPRILDRLGVDKIDLLQVHWPCQQGTPIEDTFTTLARLQEEGLFLHLGVCNYDGETLARIHQITPIVSHQSPYSLIRREYEATLAPVNTHLGIASMAYEPLCRGLLTGKYTERPRFPSDDLRSTDERFQGPAFSHIQKIVTDLTRAAKRRDVPTAALCLGWVLQRSDFVLAGAKTPEQVKQNIQAVRVVGDSKLWTIVDKIIAIHGGVPRF